MFMMIIPNKCLTCRKDIPLDKDWNTGKVQMQCKVHGFPPFEMTTVLSWCSPEHFLEWLQKNVDELNVRLSAEELLVNSGEQSEVV